MTNETVYDEDGKPIDFERMTQRQCAAAFGVTTRTLRDWYDIAHHQRIPGIGPFPRNKDGTYPLRGMMCWVMLYNRVKNR